MCIPICHYNIFTLCYLICYKCSRCHLSSSCEYRSPSLGNSNQIDSLSIPFALILFRCFDFFLLDSHSALPTAAPNLNSRNERLCSAIPLITRIRCALVPLSNQKATGNIPFNVPFQHDRQTFVPMPVRGAPHARNYLHSSFSAYARFPSPAIHHIASK